jgi:hypothetical protein
MSPTKTHYFPITVVRLFDFWLVSTPLGVVCGVAS